MLKRIIVGNLPFGITEPEVRHLFERYGSVHEVNLITDRITGRSPGFGLVEIDAQDVDKVISALNGKEFGGRTLRIGQAQERETGGSPDARSRR